MNSLNSIRFKFYQFLNDDIGRKEFEEWVQSCPELENEFQADHYNDLICFPYKSGDVKSYIIKLVKTFYDYGEYELWRTMRLLKQISIGEIETVLATRKLRRLYREQEDSLGTPLITIGLGIGFESMMDDFPIESEYKEWNQIALKKKLETVDVCRDDLIQTASVELKQLSSSENTSSI